MRALEADFGFDEYQLGRVEEIAERNADAFFRERGNRVVSPREIFLQAFRHGYGYGFSDGLDDERIA